MNVAVRPLRVLSLCTGVGGLELALQLALPGATRLVAAVERDPHAAAVLVARMEDEALDQAPVWDDLVTFDGAAWRGRVDLLVGGFPCQPFSEAGQGRGVDDERWLWPDIARILDDTAPQVAFFENVPPLAVRGFDHVLRDLARLGFDAEWSCLSAAAVGATHRRDRFWILAYRDGCRLPLVGRHVRADGKSQPRDDTDGPGGPSVGDASSTRRPEDPGSAPGNEGSHGRGTHTTNLADGPGEDVAHPNGSGGPPGQRPVDPRPAQRSEPRDGSDDLADPAGTGPQGRVHRAPQRREGPPRRSEDLPLFPPGPDYLDRWRELLDVCPGVEPAVLRDADGTAHRLDRLHAIGNGVVPLVAATAFLGLALRAGLLDEEGGLT